MGQRPQRRRVGAVVDRGASVTRDHRPRGRAPLLDRKRLTATSRGLEVTVAAVHALVGVVARRKRASLARDRKSVVEGRRGILSTDLMAASAARTAGQLMSNRPGDR